jgi:hypothetical protein
MKVIATAALLLALVGSRQSAQAFAKDPEFPTPSTGLVAGGGIKASPLVRYLAATLHLSAARTLVVQAAVQHHERLVRTPDLLTKHLRKVLTPAEFARFERLHESTGPDASLRELAVR